MYSGKFCRTCRVKMKGGWGRQNSDNEILIAGFLFYATVPIRVAGETLW
jgi:hypothetical protein